MDRAQSSSKLVSKGDGELSSSSSSGYVPAVQAVRYETPKKASRYVKRSMFNLLSKPTNQSAQNVGGDFVGVGIVGGPETRRSTINLRQSTTLID